jgi:hypothetical protein
MPEGHFPASAAGCTFTLNYKQSTMKKYAFVLLAGSIIGLSACGSDSNTNTQEQIDSAVNAKTAELEAARNAQTDSILNEMARMKADSVAMADSIAKAANTSSTTVTKTTTTTKTSKPATTKPATTTDGRLDINKNNGAVNDGRVNLDKKGTKEGQKKQDNEGRLKLD